MLAGTEIPGPHIQPAAATYSMEAGGTRPTGMISCLKLQLSQKVEERNA